MAGRNITDKIIDAYISNHIDAHKSNNISNSSLE